MFDRFRELQISLNPKKCIFCVPHGNLLGHIVCKEGVFIGPAKVVVIMNMPPPTSTKLLHSTLGHTGYYHSFIKRYETIIAPLEFFLKNSELFWWTLECEKEFNILK